MTDTQITQNQDQSEYEVVHASYSFSGPLPPPAVLAQYEKISSGSAEKMINLSIDQARHRMDLENKVVASDIRDSKIGLILAFGIGMAGFVACIFLAKLGYGTASSIIGGGTLIALVGSFIYGS